MEDVGDDVTALVVGAEVARERRAQAGATPAVVGPPWTAAPSVAGRLLAHAEELECHIIT